MKGVKPTNEREIDLINCGWAEKLTLSGARGAEQEAEVAKNFYADISQSIAGKPWGTSLQSVCRGQRILW